MAPQDEGYAGDLLARWRLFARQRLLARLRAKLTNGSGQDLQIIGLSNDRKAVVNGLLSLVAITGRKQDRNFRMMLAHDARKLQTGDAAGHENVRQHERIGLPSLQLA